MSELNLDNLSPEQMKEMLKAALLDNAALTKDKEKLTQSNATLEEEKANLQSKLHTQTQRADKAESELNALKECVRIQLELRANQTKECHKRIILLDDYKSKSVLEQIEFMSDEFRIWIDDALSWFAQTPMGHKGNDVKSKNNKPSKSDSK